MRELSPTVRSDGAFFDVGQLLDYGEWTRLQKLVVAVTALAIVLDGFDLQLIAFSIPALLKEWHVSRAAFGPILAAGLIFMTLGTAAAGILGDRIGRRKALICSVLWFGAMTAATAFAHDLLALGVLRCLAGAGLGGAMPIATALSAEFTPLQRRPLAISMTVVCVPVGGVLAGAVAATILGTLGWQYLFVIGGVAAMALAVLLILVLPESPRFLVHRAERRAELAKLMARMGRPVPNDARISDVAEESRAQDKVIGALFGAASIRNTVSLWVGFFASMLSIYLALNWLPAFLGSRGFSLSQTSTGLTAYNFGGVLGALVCSTQINRFGSRNTMMTAGAAGIGGALFLLAAPITPMNGVPLTALAILGFFANGVQSNMFALAAHLYPTAVRARGVAAAVAAARCGAILSAFVGAALVQAGSREYFGAIACAMLVTLGGLALISTPIPRYRKPTPAEMQTEMKTNA